MISGTDRNAAKMVLTIRPTTAFGAVLGAATRASGNDARTVSAVPAIDMAKVSRNGMTQCSQRSKFGGTISEANC